MDKKISPFRIVRLNFGEAFAILADALRFRVSYKRDVRHKIRVDRFLEDRFQWLLVTVVRDRRVRTK